MSRLLFIVGSGRSGTSLLWRCLNSDPAVSLAGETHFLDQWLRKHPDPAELWAHFQTHPHCTRNVGVDVRPDLTSPRALFASILSAARGEARVGGDKTCAHFRHVGRLLTWFPTAHVVFVLREPRAVVASFRAHDEAWSNGSLVETSRLWNDATAAALRWQFHPRVHILRYEDLVTEPRRVLRDLWPRAVGHDFDPSWLPSAGGGRYASGSIKGTSPVQSDRISSWRGRLGPAELALVGRLTRAEAAAFGYAVDGPVASWTTMARAVCAEDLMRLRRALRSPRSFARRVTYRMQRRVSERTAGGEPA